MVAKAYRLPPLVPLTDATGSGLWPTPNRMDSMAPRSDDALARAMTKGGCSNLKDVVPRPHLWPTPTARDWRSGKASPATLAKNSRPLSEQIGGSLNPTWVEWLMGFPLGWTELPRSETPLSRKSSKR